MTGERDKEKGKREGEGERGRTTEIQRECRSSGQPLNLDQIIACSILGV
jgi:hypothetical protein